MEIKELLISDLTEYGNNPRHNEKAIDAVAESIKQFGFKVPLVIDRDGIIVAGHTRLKAARKLGLEKVPCVVADDLTPEQVKAFRLADNKTAELAEWDFELLESELQDLQAYDMDLFGFDTLPSLFDSENAGEDYLDDIDEDSGEESNLVKFGSVWQLGNHRLICGDSTNAETIAELMNGEYADLLVTDPPYNVNIEGGTDDKLTIINDNMESEEFYNFLKSALSSADNVMKAGAGFYIWYGEIEGLNFRRACRDIGWNIKQTLIWVKNVATMGRQDYQWMHEPCLYGWKDGAGHYFIKNRKQKTVIDRSAELDIMSAEELRQIIRDILDPTDILKFDKPLRNDLHPTMKPIPLIETLIKNSSKRGQKVLDIFGGSGTTLLACESLNRQCFICEYDERYASVIVKRWETMTGDKAIQLK